MTAQANTAAATTVSFTSTGEAINFVVAVNPNTSWLHVTPSGQQVTPAMITVSTDPMPAGVYSSFLTVTTQGSVFNVPVTLNISVVGVSPSSLIFQYILGGSAPPAQNVAVTLPPNVTATVSRSTTSGGNWLNFAASGSPLSSIQVQIDPVVVATLTPGNYSGTITVTPSGSNATPATVSVTLSVSATPQITVTPASLAFNYQIGGTNNLTQQTITLTAGSQAIPFAFTSDSWIMVSPPSGTVAANTSQPVTVTITPPSQTPGNYNGTITLTTYTTQKIPVSITVSNNPLLNVPLTPISFTWQIGSALPSPATVTPTSTGSPIPYTVTANQTWLVVPTSGLTPNPVSIGVNPGNLGPGTYMGMVTITNAVPGSSGQQIPVTLKVTNNPVLIPSTTSMAFVFQTGQQLPSPQTVSLSSATGVPLNYAATASVPWLTLVGHTISTAPDSFTVSANPAGLPAMANTGQINIAVTDAATGASLGNVVIAVTLYVSNTSLLVATPSQPVVLTAQAPTNQTVEQDVILTSTDTSQLTLSVGPPQTSSGGGWLFASGPPTATPGTLRLVAVPNGLGPGTYNGSVSVTATGPNGPVLDSPYTIPVTLVLTSGTIAASPSSLTFSQTAGGAPPLAQTISVTGNVPSLNFFVTPYDGGLGWLSATTATGATPGQVSVSVAGAGLSQGTYFGKVIISSTNAGGSPLVIPVTLQISAGTISAPTQSLVFTAAQGSTTTLTASVPITGTPGALNFTASTSTANSGNWLSAAPSSGTTPANLQVAANPSGLAINTYSGSVTIVSPGAAGSPIVIPVTLNIVAPQTLTATPQALSFAYTVGQTVPSSQSVQVQSSGAATPFTVTTQVNGGGTWLQAAPPNGTTPGTVAVSVSPQGLAAGKYTGTVLIASVNAIAATPVQVTLTVTQTPKPVITSIKNGASYFLGAVSPGENVTMMGTGIGPATLTLAGLDSNGLVATTVANTQVMFDNVAAPIIYVSATQTSVIVPYEVFGKPTTAVTVIYQGVASDPVVYNVVAVAPGIYTLNEAGFGQGVIFNQDGITVNGPNAPAAKGTVIALYLTGEGETAPPGANGLIAPVDGSGLKHPLATVTANVGGVAAAVAYSGSAPGIVNGIAQINVQIPPGAPSGPSVPLILTFTAPGYAASTQPGVTLAVQ
jgi:uncharacterized protein (TIGR03437 family)